MRTIYLTFVALLAFAGNSILCRLALGDESIDAASFTAIRLLSGALMLMLILAFKSNEAASGSKGSWGASLLLFVYAISFSYAYISLETGIGALILFAAVQISMICWSFFSGNRPKRARVGRRVGGVRWLCLFGFTRC